MQSRAEILRTVWLAVAVLVVASIALDLVFISGPGILWKMAHTSTSFVKGYEGVRSLYIAPRIEKPLIVVLGQSSVREGISEKRLAEIMGDTFAVLNVALAGAGNSEPLLYLTALKKRGVKPAALVYGYNQIYFRERSPFNTGLAEFFTKTELEEVFGRQSVSRLTPAIALASTVHARLPAIRYRMMVGAWINHVIASAFHTVAGASFMADHPRVQRVADKFAFLRKPQDAESVYDRMGTRLESWVWAQHQIEFTRAVQRPLYKMPGLETESFRRLMEEMNSFGVPCILIDMPEHADMRGAYPPGLKEEYSAWIQELAANYPHTVSLNAWDKFGPDDFYNHNHLNKFGRETLTRQVAELLLNKIHQSAD